MVYLKIALAIEIAKTITSFFKILQFSLSQVQLLEHRYFLL